MRKGKQYLWEIIRIGGVTFATCATCVIGSVYAADQVQARKAAIAELKIRPADQWRLLLRRV